MICNKVLIIKECHGRDFSLYVYAWQLSATLFHTVPLAWWGFSYNETKEQLFILVIFDNENMRVYKWKKAEASQAMDKPWYYVAVPVQICSDVYS